MIRALALAVAALCLAPSLAAAQGAPATVSFVARLQDQGLPLMGSHDFKLVIYDAPSGGNNVWQETRTGVAVGTDGLLYLDLGSVTPLTSTVFAGGGRYLEITIDQNAPASPRILLESVPYALRSTKASDADTLQGIAPTAFQKAITSTCTGTQSIQSVASDGSVTCYTGQVYTAAAGGGLLASNNMFSVDPTVYQKRIVGCASGAIASVAADGTATCVTVPTSAGTGIDTTKFAAGQVAVDFTTVQHSIAGCASGSVLHSVDAAGNPTCYSNGSGLNFASGQYSVDTTAIQARVTGTCSGGSAISAIAANGTVTCAGGAGATIGAVVNTSQATTSTTYTDLGTAGPAASNVTIGVSGAAIVTVTALVQPSANQTAFMGFAVSGATTVAASDSQALVRDYGTSSSTGYIQASATFYVTGLTAGTNTFTAKYRCNINQGGACTGTFANRNIIVNPL